MVDTSVEDAVLVVGLVFKRTFGSAELFLEVRPNNSVWFGSHPNFFKINSTFIHLLARCFRTVFFDDTIF